MDLATDIKQLIISSLNLEGVTPEQIVDDAPLFEEGLGLDSIDALELAVAIERQYRVTISDEAAGKKVFSSVSSPAAYVTSTGRSDVRAPVVCVRRRRVGLHERARPRPFAC